MVKMRNAILLMITTICLAQGKHSLLIQPGYFTSNIEGIAAEPVKSPYLGIGYGYKFNNYFSASVEPGIKLAGFRSDSLKRDPFQKGLYFNIPLIGSLDIGRNKLIIGLDAGFNSNFKVYSMNGIKTPKYYPEAIVGLRAGYKLSPKVSLEAVYRYGGGLNKFASQNLNSNYLLLQTRINL